MKPKENLLIEDLIIHQIKNQVGELSNVATALLEAVQRKTLVGSSRHHNMISSLERMTDLLAKSVYQLTHSTKYFADLAKKNDNQSHELLDSVRHATDLVATSLNLYGIKIECKDEISTGLAVNVPFLLSSFVIVALINNAEDAIKYGEISNGVISIEVEEKLEEILVHITDNGPGVPETICATLFVEQAKSTKPNSKGVGLYLSNSLLKEFQSYINLTSQRKPTKFTIHFPKSSKERQQHSKIS